MDSNDTVPKSDESISSPPSDEAVVGKIEFEPETTASDKPEPPPLVRPAAVRSKWAPPEKDPESTTGEPRDDDALFDLWSETVTDSKIIYQNKQWPHCDMLKYFQSKMKIPNSMTMARIKSMEIQLGNLLQEITVELNRASIAARVSQERRKEYLGRAKPSTRARTKDMVEGELLDQSEEYRMVRAISVSADINHQFWESMRKLCLETLDRIRQIGMLEMAEVKRFGPGQY